MDIDNEKKFAHEQAEAKRKAEWKKKREEIKAAEQAEWYKAISKDKDALIASSVKRLGEATERLTRRNMKLCVTEYVQTKCYEDIEFAKHVLYPRKNMINCFHYINRKAREYIEQEMKDNDEKPDRGVFGGDVPDDVCYEWAVEYFTDMNIEEDKNEYDREYRSRPYRSSTGTSAKPKDKPAKKETDDNKQISLFESISDV